MTLPTTSEPVMLRCSCGNWFEKPTTRGRPPVSCPPCREERAKPKTRTPQEETETFTCEDCETTFDRKIKRGSKPRFCTECADKRKEKTRFVATEKQKLDGEAIVDHLEMMLRSRGMHIKQQKELW